MAREVNSKEINRQCAELLVRPTYFLYLYDVSVIHIMHTFSIFLNYIYIYSVST